MEKLGYGLGKEDIIMPFDNTRIDELLLFSWTEEEQVGKPIVFLEEIESHLAIVTVEDLLAEKQELLDLLHAKLDSNYVLTLEEITKMLKMERET